MTGILKNNQTKPKMLLTCSFGFAILLIVIALANLLWFFLLPAKGESHPTVQLVVEIQRTVKRAEDRAEADWSILRKQIKKQKMQLSMIQSDKLLSYKDLQTINKIVEALYSFVEGNWRLYEMDEEPESAKRLYDKSLDILDDLSDRSLEFTILIDPQNEDSRKINMSNSVADLNNLVRDQIQFMEEEFGI